MGIYRHGFPVFTETLVNEVEFVFVNILSWHRSVGTLVLGMVVVYCL